MVTLATLQAENVRLRAELLTVKRDTLLSAATVMDTVNDIDHTKIHLGDAHGARAEYERDYPGFARWLRQRAKDVVAGVEMPDRPLRVIDLTRN